MTAPARPSICLTRPESNSPVFPEKPPDTEYLASLYPPAHSEFTHSISVARTFLSGCTGPDFYRLSTEKFALLLDAQVVIVAKQYASHLELPPLGSEGSCLFGLAMHTRLDREQPETTVDFQYSAFACPCGLMKHDKTVLVPTGFRSSFPKNPHTKMPVDAYMAVPMFRGVENIGHVAAAWSTEALARSNLSWTLRELALHIFAEIAVAHIARYTAPRTSSSPQPGSPDGFIPYIAPLASNLNHEIRTPLQGVIGLLDVLYATLTTKGDTDVLDLIQTIQSSGKHLVELIDNMHEYCGPLQLVAKIEKSTIAGPTSPPASPNHRKRRSSDDNILPPPKVFLKNKEGEEKIKLCNFIRDIVVDASKSHDAVARFGTRRDVLEKQGSFEIQLSSSDGRTLSLLADIENDVPEYVWIDAEKVQQALSHIIVNAIKFTEKGSVTVNARLSQPFEISFSVIDTGVGVPEHLKPRLFTPFAQADSSTTRWRDGAGLGLTLARRSIRSLRGDVWLHSSSENGSEFCIRLPFTPCSPSSSLFSFFPIKVMIVEDNPINRQMAYSMFKKLGWLATHVTVCEHGQEAVDKFSGQELVLMDCWMPVLDGFGATKRILEISHERGFHTEVVAITADTMKDNLDKTLRSGMAGYVVKPFQIKDLEQVVVRLFAHALIKAFRASKNHQEVLLSALTDCRNEVKSQDGDVKAMAILKLVWLQMMGFDTSWASFHIIEVMSNPKYYLKRIGYLAATICFDRDTDVLMLATNLLKKDLNSSNPLKIGISINGLSHIVTPSLARDLNSDILSMLSHSRPYVRKKAVLVLFKIFLQYPEALRIAFPRLQEKLLDPDPSVVCAAVNVVCELARKAPKNYLVLAPQLFNLLTTSQNNWMLIKIIKLFTALTPLEPRLVKKLVPQLSHILQTSTATSLLYEAINAIVSGEMLTGEDALAAMCVDKLGSFFQEPDQNLHYVGLLALAKIAPTHSYLLADLDAVVLDCIDDVDMSIRLRALDLIYHTADKGTFPDTVKRLMLQLLPSSPLDISPFYRTEVVNRILELGKKDSFANISNFEWFVATLVDLTKISDCDDKIAHEIVNVAIRVRTVRPYVVTQMEHLISQGVTGKLCLAVGWIVGEYPSFLQDPLSTIHYLCSATQMSTDIHATYLHALAKVYTYYIRSSQEWTLARKSSLVILTEKIITSLSQYTTSIDLDLQERATQFSSLFTLALEFLSSAPVGEILSEDGFEDGKPPQFVTETMAELFGLYELAPVGPNAQTQVPLPNLDLDEWINRPTSPDPVFVDLAVSEQTTHEDTKQNQAERRERMRDDPFYIPSTPSPTQIDIDSIPIVELNLGAPKDVVKFKKPKKSKRDVSPPRMPIEIVQEEVPEGAVPPLHPEATEPKRSLLGVDASKLLQVDFEKEMQQEEEEKPEELVKKKKNKARKSGDTGKKARRKEAVIK